MNKKKNLEKELENIGIKNETQLKEAIAKLPPLKLYIMTAEAAGVNERKEIVA